MSASAALYSNLEEENPHNAHQEMALFLAKYVLGWNVKISPKSRVFKKPFGKVTVLNWNPLTKAKDYEEVLHDFIRNPIWYADYVEHYGLPEEESDCQQCMQRMVGIVKRAREKLEALKVF